MQFDTKVFKSTQAKARREQLISIEELSQITMASDREGGIRLAQHFSALIVLGVLMLILPYLYSWIPALIYSAFLIFSFCPLHESIHSNLFATRRWNRLSGFVLGLILVLPPRYFYAFHMAHHRYTQLPGKDPELATPKPATKRQYFWVVSGIPYALSEIHLLLRGAFGVTDSFVPQNQKKSVILEARIFLIIYLVAFVASVLLQSMALIWFWLLPLAIGQPLLRLFLMAEHTGCAQVEEMLSNSRTTYSNRAMTWFCWNMNHHTAHHAYASVPFFRLKEVTEILKSRISVTESGYIKVHRKILPALNSF